jgi:hypothetical protein
MADSASLAGAAGAADRVAAAHQALLRESGLQFEFEAEPPPPELPDWFRAFFEFLGGFQPVFEVLFWAAIAPLVGLILYFVARELLRHYQKEASGGSLRSPAVIFSIFRRCPRWRASRSPVSSQPSNGASSAAARSTRRIFPRAGAPMKSSLSRSPGRRKRHE